MKLIEKNNFDGLVLEFWEQGRALIREMESKLEMRAY